MKCVLLVLRKISLSSFIFLKEFIMANDLVAATTPEMKLSWAFRM